MSTVAKLIEKMNLNDQASVNAALAEAVNDNNVKVGGSVAVVGDPTYPFDGQKGVVKSMSGGFAEVKFDNVAEPVPLHINLLIPV
jgi:hypothetical protein